MLDLRHTPAFTDFFVLCSGQNTRQVKAIADAIEDALRAAKVRPAHVEGYERAEWILMDFFTFIVHVFTPQTRDFYSLERLWGDAERIEMTDDPQPSARERVGCRGASRRAAHMRSLSASGFCRRSPTASSPSSSRRPARRAHAPLDASHARAGLRRAAGTPSSRFTPPLCRRCGDPLPSWRVLALDATAVACARGAGAGRRRSTRSRAIGAYDGTLRAIVHAFKYDGCRSLSHGAGRALARQRRRAARGRGLVVPVPLHRSRAAAARLQPGARARARISACRWSTPCGERARRPRRRTCRPTRGTPTCATRSRSGAGAPAALDGLRDRAGGRREHDGRDAGGVRARCCARRARAEVSAVTAARVVSRPRVMTSAATSALRALAVEAHPAGARRPGGGSSRARATAARGRARTGREPPPCGRPRSRARCRAGSSGAAPAGTAGSRRATRRRARALRRRRCSRRGSDRRSRRRRRRSSDSICAPLLVAVGDVQQLHDVGRIVALAVQRLGDLAADRRRVVGKRQQLARRARAPSAWSRSVSACVCLPLWSRPSKAMSDPGHGCARHGQTLERQQVVDRLAPADDARPAVVHHALRPAACGGCSSTP